MSEKFYIQKTDTTAEDDTDSEILGLIEDDEIAWNRLAGKRNKLHKTLLGKILLTLQMLLRKKPEENTFRWEIASDFVPAYVANVWNILTFGREIIRGDYIFTNNTGTYFRAQIPGNYRISAMVTFSVAQWYWAKLALFKNGVFYSYLKIVDGRINDTADLIWLYFATIDLAGSSDIIFLNIGDVIDIRMMYNCGVSGGGITDVTGFLTGNYVGFKNKKINDTVNTWSS